MDAHHYTRHEEEYSNDDTNHQGIVLGIAAGTKFKRGQVIEAVAMVTTACSA